MDNGKVNRKPEMTSPLRKILFVVNPNAGKKNSISMVEFIREEFPKHIFYEVLIWQVKEDFKSIEQQIRTQTYTDVVAVGGDGTVNQVAKALIGTEICLGILPIGSGNGLARSLGLSMNAREAIQQIVAGRRTKIDAGNVNGIPFFCTSGIGFDAHIGHLFATSIKRGLSSYVKITIAELFSYRAGDYVLKFNGTEIKRKAFLITVANAGQYGNDFYISPQANMRDGLFHVVILKPFHFFKVFGIFFQILRRKAYLSSSIETIVTNKITISRNQPGVIHFDGEPATMEREVVFENTPQAINVIVGKNLE